MPDATNDLQNSSKKNSRAIKINFNQELALIANICFTIYFHCSDDIKDVDKMTDHIFVRESRFDTDDID